MASWEALVAEHGPLVLRAAWRVLSSPMRQIVASGLERRFRIFYVFTRPHSGFNTSRHYLAGVSQNTSAGVNHDESNDTDFHCARSGDWFCNHE